VGIFYSVAIRGGELRHEIGGSTDLAAWIPMSDVAQLERTVTIDVAFNMYGTKPASGHVDPAPVGGRCGTSRHAQALTFGRVG
jgi:8-oxo-dGTP diphosphatase